MVTPKASDAMDARSRSKRHRRIVVCLYNASRRKTVVIAAAVLLLWVSFRNIPFGVPRISLWKTGPPSSLIVRGKRIAYTKPPPEFRKSFLFPLDAKLDQQARGLVRRSFRGLAWWTAADVSTAHFLFDRQENTSRYEQLQPWQRYNCIPGTRLWNNRHFFASYLNQYKQQRNASLWFWPETYQLNSTEDRVAFKERLSEGGMDRPWVLKRKNPINNKGIVMLGPHEHRLKTMLKSTLTRRYIVQAYICNPLTWNLEDNTNHKFDLRAFWAVVSVDPLIVVVHNGYPLIGQFPYDETNFRKKRPHYIIPDSNANDLGNTTFEDVEQVLWKHHQEAKLSKVGDPVQHVCNQIKEAIGTMVSAFKDVTFGNDKDHKLTTENAYGGIYASDFIIDKDLDAWYISATMIPSMLEEFDTKLELHRLLYRSFISTVEEIVYKQEADPNANLLPLENLGGWEIVYAGEWQYRYKGYKRSNEKKACKTAGGGTKAVRPSLRKRGKVLQKARKRPQ